MANQDVGEISPSTPDVLGASTAQGQDEERGGLLNDGRGGSKLHRRPRSPSILEEGKGRLASVDPSGGAFASLNIVLKFMGMICEHLGRRKTFVMLNILMIVVSLMVIRAFIWTPRSKSAIAAAGLDKVVANDLYGIHDLLLVGYAGVFVRDGGAAEVIRRAAVELIDMLTTLHPTFACRRAVVKAVAGAEGLSELSKVSSVADSVWACLPGNFSSASFTSTFNLDAVQDVSLRVAAKSPRVEPQFRSQLGACNESGWDRTCSYWSSLHVLAARAEMSGMGARFLRAAIVLLFGGATMCKG